MKLLDVPPGTLIRVKGEVKIPPGAPPINVGDELMFIRIDGMYSLCYKDKQPVHLVAWADVEIVK